MLGQRTGLEPATLIELAKVSDSLLNNPPTHANAAHKAPVTVDLPVLLANRVAQIHATNKIRLAASRKHPRSALHTQISSSQQPTP
jgi:hypothetical protein